MIKHLSCILLLAFLFIGVSQFTHRNDLQRFRPSTGVSDHSTSFKTLSPSDSASFSSLELLPSPDEYAFSIAFTSKGTDSYSLGILTMPFVPRGADSVKTLKYNDIPTIVQLLSSQDSHLSENKWKIRHSDIDYLKYSTKYYLYTLSHILI